MLLLGALLSTVTTAAQNLPGNSNPRSILPPFFLSDTFLFAANDGITGTELWRHRFGSTPPTTPIADLAPADASSNPRELVHTWSGVVFVADGSQGTQLYQVNSMSGSPQMIGPIPNLTSGPYNLCAVGHRVFFVAGTAAHGEELWSFDSSNPPSMVLDIEPGPTSSHPQQLAAFDGRVVFSAWTAAVGREPWLSNGSVGSTSMLLDIRPGTIGSAPTDFTVHNYAGARFVLFAANDGTLGKELWRTQGTAVGTYMVKDIEPGPAGSFPGKAASLGFAVFAATTSASGREPWRTDGTLAGTQLIADVLPGAGSSNPSDWQQSNLLDWWFLADDATLGRQVWRTQGTTWNTSRLTSLAPAGGPSDLHSLTNLPTGGRMVFAQRSYPPALWSIDTTTLAATELQRFASDPSEFSLISLPSAVAFAGDTKANGTELWSSDGTISGTHLVKNIAPDVNGPAVSLGTHIDPAGTQWTLCIEDGPPNGLGIIGISLSPPGPPVFVPGLSTGPILLSTLDLTAPVILDAAGYGCVTVNVGSISQGELVAQGFSLPQSLILPLDSSDLGTLSVTTTPLFGGTARLAGTFRDKDHRYEIGASLPQGTSSDRQGRLFFQYVDGAQKLNEVKDKTHQTDYDGIPTNVFLGPKNLPKADIKAIELWFQPDEEQPSTPPPHRRRIWKSYC